MFQNCGDYMVRELPRIKIANKEFFIDGRLLELRNVNDIDDKIRCEDSTIGAMVCSVDLLINRDNGKIIAIGNQEIGEIETILEEQKLY